MMRMLMEGMMKENKRCIFCNFFGDQQLIVFCIFPVMMMLTSSDDGDDDNKDNNDADKLSQVVKLSQIVTKMILI